MRLFIKGISFSKAHIVNCQQYRSPQRECFMSPDQMIVGHIGRGLSVHMSTSILSMIFNLHFQPFMLSMYIP